MVDPVQAAVGIVVLLVVVGGLLYLFYSRTNAVEKTGFGALIMLSLVSLMIPVFWIMETNGQAQAKVQQHTTSVTRGALLYANDCAECHGLNGQGLTGSGPKLNGNSAVNNLSDNDLLRIISAGAVDPNDASKSLMPAFSQQYGGALTQDDIQYLFDLIRSADPAYLTKNGYPTGSGSNGFDQVSSQLQGSSVSAYSTAIAQSTASAEGTPQGTPATGTGQGTPAATPTPATNQFGAPVDMTGKNAVTINIVNSPSGATCQPSCFQVLNVKVKVGTKITWVNQSTAPHTVTAIKGTNPAAETPDASIFDSGLNTPINPNASYSYTVTMAAYNANPNHIVVYYCQFHTTMLAMITIVK